MLRLITCLASSAVALAGCATTGVLAQQPLPGTVDITPEHAMSIPRAQRPGAVFGIVLEDGSVLTTPSRRWKGHPLRITSLTSDATATATRVLDWSLDDHWVLLEAEWRTGAPVAADLGAPPAPGDPLRIYAVRDSGDEFEFLEPRRLRPSTTRAPSLLHSANVIFKQPRAALGVPVVNEGGQIVGFAGDFATSSGARLKLGLIPIEAWHQATIRIATFPGPQPDARPVPLEHFIDLFARRDEVDRRLDAGRKALEEQPPHVARGLAIRTLGLDPHSTRAMTLAAEADMAAGDWSGAIESLRPAIARQARPLALQGLLAECLLRRGERDEAVALARRIGASAAPDEVTALQRAAYVLEQSDLAPEAAAIWRRILDAQPRHAAAAAALDRLDAR